MDSDHDEGEPVALEVEPSLTVPWAQQSEAPHYLISNRAIGAVEIPMMVTNLDRALDAFSAVRNKGDMHSLLDGAKISIPFYLNPDSPWRQPIASHAAKTHNIVLKITVPKRTGRRRRRGTDDPFEFEAHILTPRDTNDTIVCSISPLDDPRILRRKLADNVGAYHVDAVGVVAHTHRFRGLADFYWNLESSPFIQTFREQVHNYHIDDIKGFQLGRDVDKGTGVDIVPPPAFTKQDLSFNFSYSQNTSVRKVGEDMTINTTIPLSVGHFINMDEPIPDGPKFAPDLTDKQLVKAMPMFADAFKDRPIWTRRALLNRLGRSSQNWNLIKKYINYTAYQFKGGPWRDSFVVYGVDPRQDPKFSIYQSMTFQLVAYPGLTRKRAVLARTNVRHVTNQTASEADSGSHLFDGKTLYTDGKVWQVCDLIDPLLCNLFSTATVRSTPSQLSGWYHAGLWVKAKSIMKVKITALLFDRPLFDSDFHRALAVGDQSPPTGSVRVPVPDLNLTDNEIFQLTGKLPSTRRRKPGYQLSRQPLNFRDRLRQLAHARARRTTETSGQAPVHSQSLRPSGNAVDDGGSRVDDGEFELGDAEGNDNYLPQHHPGAEEFGNEEDDDDSDMDSPYSGGEDTEGDGNQDEVEGLDDEEQDLDEDEDEVDDENEDEDEIGDDINESEDAEDEVG